MGGGPVGVEFAGEISSQYLQKNITLVHSGKILIGEPFNAKLGQNLLNNLEKMGVRVVLEERVLLNDLKLDKFLQPRTFMTDKGTAITTDLLLLCYGENVNSHYL
ncbi:MAG: NAD(P)/FAD-dependent oxidoreductase [Pseudanabaenales cyanobacterium]|nr:NAD(P)/FAD-dependent oxidoreductase [Pseudanabaenales cyanobacterium]